MVNHRQSEARGEVIQAVKVSLEVRSGAARFHVAVRAENIQRAVSTVAARYPGRGCRVKVPIDPKVFSWTTPLLERG
jgi:hypothetical protein